MFCKKAVINSTHFQNVPVRTAKDWADEVKLFCQGKLKMTKYSFMKQDNTTHTIISTGIFNQETHYLFQEI